MTSKRGTAASLRAAAGILALAAILGLVAYEWSEYRLARETATHELRQLARMSELQTAHMYEALSLAMTAAENMAGNLDWTTPRAAPQATAGLRRLKETVPFVRHLGILDEEGMVRATAAQNPPAELSYASEAGFRTALAAGNADALTIGDLELTPVRYDIVIPIYRRFGGSAPGRTGVVRATITPAYLASQYSGLPVGFDATFLLLNASGGILAVSPWEAFSDLVGTEVEEDVLRHLGEGAEATIEYQSKNGKDVIGVYRRVGEMPLIVAATMDRQTIFRRWLEVFKGHAIFIALASVMSLLLYLALRRRLLREDQIASELGHRVESQTQELRRALDAQELLLRELHHRVKNNLQIMTSLLGMQAGKAPQETARRFRDCQQRMAAIAQMHEQMYTSGEAGSLNARRFLLDFAPEVARAYGAAERIDLKLDLDDLRLNVEQATPFVLLTGEILTNAFKHGFAEGARGTITVGLHREGSEAVFQVADDGRGMPADAKQQAHGLGMTLMEGLAKQLGGELTLDSDARGTRCTVRFSPAAA